MGSGKSTVGKKISSALGWDLIDLDKEIERREGKQLHEIFSGEGEAYFRKIESEVLRDLITDKNLIISCGGGTPCFHSNMDFMVRNGITVYLKMEAEELRSRLINSHSTRPLIKNLTPEGLLDYINKSLSEREKYYNQSEIIVKGLDVNILSLKEIILEKFTSQK